MKKLLSILLIVTMLALCLTSCELKDKISGLFGGEEEETTTAAPEEEETTTAAPEEEETTTKKPEEETTTKKPEEETTTTGPWKPDTSVEDDKQPIEFPGIGVKPTVGQ